MKEDGFSKRKALRTLLLIAALCLIAAGISKGDFLNVMTKGVSICLECIGIG